MRFIAVAPLTLAVLAAADSAVHHGHHSNTPVQSEDGTVEPVAVLARCSRDCVKLFLPEVCAEEDIPCACLHKEKWVKLASTCVENRCMGKVKDVTKLNMVAPAIEAACDGVVSGKHNVPAPLPGNSTAPVLSVNDTAPVLSVNGTAPVLFVNGTAPVLPGNGTAVLPGNVTTTVQPETPAASETLNIPNMPECAIPCIAKAIKDSSPCSFTDTPCLCGHGSKIAKSAQRCVLQKCGLDKAIKKVVPAGKAQCGKK